MTIFSEGQKNIAILTQLSIPVPRCKYEKFLIQNQLEQPITSYDILLSWYTTDIFPVSRLISEARLSIAISGTPRDSPPATTFSSDEMHYVAKLNTKEMYEKHIYLNAVLSRFNSLIKKIAKTYREPNYNKSNLF
jgi:hypothetical protein